MHNAGNTNYIFFFSLINGLEKEANGSGGGWGRTERYLSAPAAPAFSACIIHNHPPPPRTAAGRGFATMLLLSPCKNPFSQNTPLWHRSRGGGGDGDVVAALLSSAALHPGCGAPRLGRGQELSSGDTSPPPGLRESQRGAGDWRSTHKQLGDT